MVPAPANRYWWLRFGFAAHAEDQQPRTLQCTDPLDSYEIWGDSSRVIRHEQVHGQSCLKTFWIRSVPGLVQIDYLTETKPESPMLRMARTVTMLS
jgi:hypothetical protein